MHKWHYTKTFAKPAKLDLLELQKCTNVILASRKEWMRKMGAMKSLLADATTNMYHISVDLNQASLCGDVDEMKQSLRRAIMNSALAIAYLEELEN